MVLEKKRRKAFIEQKYCVACGCCMKICPMQAIGIPDGIMAQVDISKCVGCGKCAKECPASIIKIMEVAG